jgi:transcriptional regulator with XRE-family HTH domain
MDEAELPKAFGEVVRELRQKQGVSQERLAALAGIDRAYMGGLERGLRNPSLTTIARVANGLSMKVSDVLKAVEKRSR